MGNNSNYKEISKNRKATFDYEIIERFEAGIELVGTEVKSIRAGNISLKESFIFIRDGQMILKNSHIAPYDKGSFSNVDPRRDRKLLMHKSQIRILFSKVAEKGFTLIPTKMYFKDSLIKIEVALCRGKHTVDKRRTIKEREQKISMEREIKRYV